MSGNWPEVERRRSDRRSDDRRGGDRRGTDRRGGGWPVSNRRTYIALFLFVAACIVYSALFPFNAVERGHDMGAILFLLKSAGDWNRAAHPVSSILLYLPLGVLAMFALPPGLHVRVRAMLTLAGGLLLSVWLELAQYQEAGHVTAMADVYASLVGVVSQFENIKNETGKTASSRLSLTATPRSAYVLEWGKARRRPC